MSTLDRITFDGDEDHLDEVVLTGATIHIEALYAHAYMIHAWTPDGRTVHLEAENVRMHEFDGVDDLVTIGPPLLGCGEEWGEYPVRHRCTHLTEDDGPHPTRHVCECGAQKEGS